MFESQWLLLPFAAALIISKLPSVQHHHHPPPEPHQSHPQELVVQLTCAFQLALLVVGLTGIERRNNVAEAVGAQAIASDAQGILILVERSGQRC